jgi:hypothetical protein
VLKKAAIAYFRALYPAVRKLRNCREGIIIATNLKLNDSKIKSRN